jgi:hypothetical protein
VQQADNNDGVYDAAVIDWPTRAHFHHGPEPTRSRREAEDTTAVDLHAIADNHADNYDDGGSEGGSDELTTTAGSLDRRSPDTRCWTATSANL